MYADQEAKPKEILIQTGRLKAAFPKMETTFFNLLAERIASNGFTSQRLKDAVNYVLDNFQYKELNVSDIIRFDKKTKLYTYNEVCLLATKGEAQFSDFEVREINGKVFRVRKTDLI